MVRKHALADGARAAREDGVGFFHNIHVVQASRAGFGIADVLLLPGHVLLPVQVIRLHAKGKEAGTVATLQERMFNTKVEMVYKLQELAFQTEELQSYRNELVQNLVRQVMALPRDNFAVKQHLRIIDKYLSEPDFDTLTYENTLQIAEHIAPLILPTGDDISAARFDMLIYQISFIYG